MASLLVRSARSLLSIPQCSQYGLAVPELVRNLASAPPSDDHSDQALFNRIVEGLPSSAQPTTSGNEQGSHTGTRTLDALQHAVAAKEDKDDNAHLVLLNNDYGYAVLGGVDPEDMSSDWGKGTPRVHPQRLFNPGETYSPEDLNPFFKAPPVQRQTAYRKNFKHWRKDDLYEQADFKNVPFLEQFVSDAGRLLPRKKTKLKPAYHRHVMRQVKIARTMALLPHETRIGDDQRKRLRQFEILQTQQRQALQAEANSSTLDNISG